MCLEKSSNQSWQTAMSYTHIWVKMYNAIKNGSDYTKQMLQNTHNRILTFPMLLLLTRNT